MTTETGAPQYQMIAFDIAGRIARNEFPVGSRIYGRSMMASEYNVSPETIRRALGLLAGMKVVEVKAQSGAVVLSADNARRYLGFFGENNNTRSLSRQLRDMLLEMDDLHRRMTETVVALIQQRESFAGASEPLPGYEVPVPAGSPLIGKSIGQLKFWQATGGTIAAIRRGQSVILSPGPFAELYGGDVIILVGPPTAQAAAERFVKTGTEKEET